MEIQYRLATGSELEQIAAIELEIMPQPWRLNNFREAISSDHAFIMLAMDEDNVAGYSVIYQTPPECELPDIVVAEKYRNLGIGRKLLELSKDKCRQNNIDTMFLEVRVSNSKAYKLYSSLGFEEIGIRKGFYSNPDEDAICMCWHF